MADEGESKDKEKQILYDLIVNAEWPLSPITIDDGNSELWFVGVSFPLKLWQLFHGTTWRLFDHFKNIVKFETKFGCPPPPLIDIFGSKQEWKFAISGNNKWLAILQESVIEIRSSKDDFHKLVTKWTVGTSDHPERRQLAWSTSSTLLAVSQSCGAVHCFDVSGTKVFSTTEPSSKLNLATSFSDSVASLLFKKSSPETEWAEELIVITFDGLVKTFRISARNDFMAGFQFSLTQCHPLGVSSVVHHELLDMLIIGGCHSQMPPSLTNGDTYGSDVGLSCWRFVSEEPFLVLVEDKGRGAQKFGTSYRFRRGIGRKSPKDILKGSVFKICLSPNGKELLVLYMNGDISLWRVPGMMLVQFWYNDDMFIEEPHRRSSRTESSTEKKAIDVSWWSDEAIVVLQGEGAATVRSKSSFNNLLGVSPEWFEPWSSVISSIDGQCVILECEKKVHHLGESNQLNLEDIEHRQWLGDADIENEGMAFRCKQFMKQMMYFVTEMERFQPPAKHGTICDKIYRVVSLKTTTPEELYARKIGLEEYGEALTLAEKFNLNTDHVYEKQWKTMPITTISIHDYLTKIKDRFWVLKECLDQVPDDIDATYQLLKYGLLGTDISVVKNIDNGSNIPFVTRKQSDSIIDDDDDDDDDDKRNEIYLKPLSEKQKQLCLYRYHLLRCIDRLDTYEVILGGHVHAKERFSSQFYKSFRFSNMIKECVKYAQQSDAESCDTLLTYHSDVLIPHWFGVLSNIPETTNPLDYRFLLPEISQSDNNRVAPWLTRRHREHSDWVEHPDILEQLGIEGDSNSHEFLYAASPEMERYINCQDSIGVRQWYIDRAHSIEKLAKQVHHSFTLVKLAKERGVKDLDILYDNLSVLEILTYECGVDVCMDLDTFQETKSFHKLQMLMSTTTSDSFLTNFKQWGLPFLRRAKARKEDSNQLLRQYVIDCAKTDLAFPLKIFEKSSVDLTEPIIPDAARLMKLAIECIYITQRDDQLELAFAIVECLPSAEEGILSPQVAELHGQVDQLELLLSSAEILEHHNCPRPVSFLLSLKEDDSAAKLIMKEIVTNTLEGPKCPSLTDLNLLLKHLKQLQEDACTSISKEAMIEIFAVCLLGSGSRSYIELVEDLITPTKTNQSHSGLVKKLSPKQHLEKKLTEDCIRLNYETSVNVILSAAQEYFNSAASIRDTSMELASLCLSLICDRSCEIDRELALIEAVKSLNDFSVSLLPLQVRLCGDKLELIKQCIEEKPSNYQKTDKILRLSKLLGATATGDGPVLVLVAEGALSQNDFVFSHEICNRLIALGHQPAWTVCRDLASNNGYKHVEGRKHLMSFVLAHCHADELGNLLLCHNLLETQLLQTQLSTCIQAQSDTSLIDKTVSHVSGATKGIVSSLKGSIWRGNEENQKDEQSPRNIVFKSNPFFATVHDGFVTTDCNKNQSLTEYLDHAKNISLTLQENQMKFRLKRLSDERTDESHTEEADSVLSNLFLTTVPADTTVAIGYLLALSDVTIPIDLCSHGNDTAFMLQLMCYYYALAIYKKMRGCHDMEQSHFYLLKPLELIELVNTKLMNFDITEEMDKSVNNFKILSTKLSDLAQANMLNSLGRGVDVQRFVQDADYKRETILGLAMTTDAQMLETAEFLAAKYSIPKWDVVFANMEYLLTDLELPLKDLNEAMNQLNPQPVLMKDPETLLSKSRKYIYNDIPGTDHNRLVLFFTILADCCGDNVFPKSKMDVNSHLRTIKKIKAASPGLDYKRLVSGESVLDTVKPYLNENNVHLLAKIIIKIPSTDGDFASASGVFKTHAVKLFWQGKNPSEENQSDWLHRFEACQKHFSRLDPCDIVSFVKDTSCSDRGVTDLPLEIRVAIINRCVKFARQAISKEEKKPDGKVAGWLESEAHLQRLSMHFKLLEDDTILSLYHSEEESDQTFAKQFDLSCCKPSVVNRLLIDMVVNGKPLSVVDRLSHLAKGVSDDVSTTDELFREAVCDAIAEIKSERSDIGINTLSTLMESMQSTSADGKPYVAQEDVLSVIRDFCADSTIGASIKHELMQIVQQKCHLSGQDMLLLIYYETNAITSSNWGIKIANENVDSDQHRLDLFQSLLKQSASRPQLSALVEILSVWPVLAATELGENQPLQNPWIQLFHKMIVNDDFELFVESVNQALKDNTFGPECNVYLYKSLVEKTARITAFKFALISCDEEMIDQAFDDMQEFKDKSKLIDYRLFKLILNSKLIHRTCHTPFYNPLVGYLKSIASSKDENERAMFIDSVYQLQRSGLISEASYLATTSNGFHKGFMSFNNAIVSLRKWMDR